YLWAVWLLGGLVALYWIAVAVLFGLRSRSYMAGAISAVLGAMIVFFIGGGLAMVRSNRAKVPWYSWLFPNTYAVDPVRDLVLFNRWPVDWTETLLILIGFAGLALAVCIPFAVRRLRCLG
ncbi:MAG: hypothetical protein JXB38_06840, partial [Anaerolineales bacterium]|nr:hypothetical protein [Anaerolineales bacterium]